MRLVSIALVSITLGCTGETPEQRAQAACESTTDAYVMSQDFIEQHLRAPASAKFPWMTDADVSVKYLGDCTHEVRAYVDAQNGFGALIRSRYYVKLQNQKGTSTWRALDVQIQ